MKLYNFTRLINKYSTNFTLIVPSEGQYEGGIYKDGKPTTEIRAGAIVPLSQRKVYQLGGNYTAQDKELYTARRIEKALSGCKVLYKDVYYSVEEETDYSDFGDVYHYMLRKEVEA
ncbi:MAG: hypothetical protein Q4G33_03940 [bacterium]|nr:hypothetical protein [bacterium]